MTPDTKYASLQGSASYSSPQSQPTSDIGEKSEEASEKSKITEVAVDSSSESQNSQKQILSLEGSSSVSTTDGLMTIPHSEQSEIPLQKKKVRSKSC